MNFQFNSFAELINMNGHGSYVWASYGITFVVIIGLILYSRGQRGSLLKQINTQQARQTQRQRQRQK